MCFFLRRGREFRDLSRHNSFNLQQKTFFISYEYSSFGLNEIQIFKTHNWDQESLDILSNALVILEVETIFL